jgi:hypothetical protein
MKTICNTPVTYFIYNRPEKTKRSFQAIRKARPNRLFIVADGPKDEVDSLKVLETREIVDNIDWECEVVRIFSEKNRGCALGVSSGITEVLSIVDRTIILEDDIVASEDFFVFQERMLERYKDDERVMMVTGWNSFVEYPIEGYDGFFSKSSAIWGWGTWRRAWEHYRFDPLENGEFDSTKIKELLSSYMKDSFWVNYHIQCMDAKIWQKLDTWDYQWALSVYTNHGFCITPTQNLCLNIGFDSLATHTKSDYAAAFISDRIPKVSFFIGKIRIQETENPSISWYNSARLLLYLLMMQGDLRVLYLFYKHPNLLLAGPERKGWELYLGVFKHPKICLEILDLLEKHLKHPHLTQIREVLNKI